MNAETIGILIGIVVGLIICLILFRVCNINNKRKTDYDERQEAIRGKSYKYGFYTVIIYMAILTVFYMTDIAIPFVISVVVFFGLILGVGVVATHSIWNNAYWGLNNNKGRYYIVFAVCAAINLLSGITGIVDGTILEGTQGRIINLLCGLMLLVISAVLIAKSKLAPEETTDEEDE